MAKLHEIIAVEPDLKSTAQHTIKGIKEAFANRQAFFGEVKEYQPLEEEGEMLPDEITQVTKTVDDALNDIVKDCSGWIDVSVGKEFYNAQTKADVIVDGEVLYHDLPAPALLNLENKLDELLDVYRAIPVLDLTERWHFDEGQELYESDKRTTFRTKKVLRNHVMSEATKEHPAQVQTYAEDIRVGTWEKVVTSGAVTEKHKRELVERVERLRLAVKKARQRANELEIVSEQAFSKILFGYINGKI